MARAIGGTRLFLLLATIACGASLHGCGDTDPRPPTVTLAQTSNIIASTSIPGITPFIAFMELRGNNLAELASVSYQIEPRTGTTSKPVSVHYDIGSLKDRGYFSTEGVGVMPVFGLYAGHTNHILVTLTFVDDSEKNLAVDISTSTYEDPAGIFDRPVILTSRTAGSELGFDYFALKTSLGSPVVVDTDGYIRWAAGTLTTSFSSGFIGNGFVVGAADSRALYRLELDGSLTERRILSPSPSTEYVNFHHDIKPGKQGMLVAIDTISSGVRNIESTLAEITTSGVVLREWDLAAIFRSYMQEQGDNPGAFVRPGYDWLHINGVVYDQRDDSLIVSGREDFLAKIDYETGALLWILGDPTKHWYTFPSLREKSLTLEGGGLYPLGQHAPSITSDGLLMIFNNGLPSFPANQPPGAALGQALTYSTVSAYSINVANHTAQEAWQFDFNRNIYSDICSSSYESPGKSLLINYSAANQRTRSRVVGLNARHEVVFDFEFANPNSPCSTSWNAIPIPFGDMRFH